MPAVTRFGDADICHCSGMTRQGCSATVIINGLGVSRQDDANTTHDDDACLPHSAAITTGSTTVFANGKGVGRIGDAITGCTAVAAGSPNVFAGG